MQRKNPQNAGGGSIGLYLHIKVDKHLGAEFYIPLAFELLIKSKHTGKYTRYVSCSLPLHSSLTLSPHSLSSPKGAYASPFTASNKAWGYVDMLGCTWEEFFKDDKSAYNNKGALEVKVRS